MQCGSFDAIVPSSKIAEIEKAKAEGKPWQKLPKQDAAAKEMLHKANLPPELDWVDRDIIESWSEMGMPGATETSQVHPYHFTTAMAELAQQAGVTIKTKSKVTSIDASKTGVESVEYQDTESGETTKMDNVTDVIVAAGPWTGRVLPRAKVEGLRAHSVVYDADLSPFAVFTDITLPSGFVPEHRAKMGQKRMHKGSVDPEIYARPFNEAYACGRCLFFFFFFFFTRIYKSVLSSCWPLTKSYRRTGHSGVAA